MRKICEFLKRDVGSIGIGAMIVFIAMVLVAGISGIAIYDILGYAATGSDISKLAIMVRSRAGSDGIDLSETYIELANSTIKVILNYTSTYYSEPDGQDDIFGASVFPDTPGSTPASQFGILVAEDADNSFTGSDGVVLNQGDKAFLCINVTGCFNNITERSDIWGLVVPEQGAPGVISFRTPASYSRDNVFDLH